MKHLNFQVDTRLAFLLSENYRSTERAIKELVDNAWDADAEEVNISLPKPLTLDPEIIVEDNGVGMVEQELRREYLYIASDRRQRRGERTTIKNRKVKGRKGIGKFAGLMAASKMNLDTWSRGQCCTFSINRDDLMQYKNLEQMPINLLVEQCPSEKQGTRITLTSLLQGLSFPAPDELRHLLMHDYGRETDFKILVNDKELAVDDVRGSYTEVAHNVKEVGEVKLKFTISDQKRKFQKAGLAIRVGGKVIGKPTFFGLDKAEDFPPKLLGKLYGEVEADGLADHVTADWGAIIRNSELYQAVENHLQPILRDKFKEEYGREISLAQARLQKKINDRLATLPQYKREYADKAIKRILHRYYGEPESKLEPIVNVILDSLERSDYRIVIEHLNDLRNSDVATIAEALGEFGLVDLAVMAEQATGRISYLDQLENVCCQKETLEKTVHQSIENNLWLIGNEYTLFSSNITLKRIVDEFLEKEFKGEDGSERPDLLLNTNILGQYLLIEFKRPKHKLNYVDYQQATRYRNSFSKFTDKDIKVLVIGGGRGQDLPSTTMREPLVEIALYQELISAARKSMDWLLKEIQNKN